MSKLASVVLLSSALWAGSLPVPAARARQGPRRVEPGDDDVEHEADLRSQYSVKEC
jgi:hypothetical protein